MAKKKKKNGLFSLGSLLVTVKAMAVSIIVGIPVALFQLIALKSLAAAVVLGALWGGFSLFLWGFLAGKFWNWH